MAQTVGTSCLGTAYTTANAIPNLVFEIVVGGALAGSVVPLLAGALSRGDRATARDTVAALYGWVLTLLVPAFLVVVLLRGPLASLLIGDAGSGCVTSDVHATAAALLGLFALQIPIYGLTVVSQGALQSDHRFTAPALAPLLSSLVMIGVYLAYSANAGSSAGSLSGLSTEQLWLLGAGTTVGVLVLLLTQLPGAARAGLLVVPRLRFPEGLGSRARALAGAGLATVAAQWISYAVSLRLVNQHGPQGASVVFVLAWTVLLLPWAVLVFPVATSVFPRLATSHERGDHADFAATTASSLRAVVLLAGMGAAGLIAVAVPLARFLVEGAPGRASTGELAATITALALGVVGFALVGFGGRVLYAAHRGRLAAWATITGWVIAMVLAAVVSWTVPRERVVPAVGTATSVGLVVGGVVVIVGVRRVAGAAALHRLGRAAGTAVVTLVLAGALGRGVAAALPWRGVWGSAAVAALAAAVVVAVTLAVVWCLDRSDLHALARRGVDPVASN
jgi:putative peptidoglycan lipid II flippase